MNLGSMNATVLPGALASESGTLFLHDPGSGDWGSRVSNDSSGLAMDAFSMNELLIHTDKDREMQFICKIDIEGGERDLLSRNVEWVSKFPVVIIEIHDWMLPGESVSKNLFTVIGDGNFDVVIKNDLLFILNNDLLR